MTDSPPPRPRANDAAPFRHLPLTTSQRVVATMAHLFAIIPVWGLVADFWIWHTRREEHPELRFQALQALILQAIGLLITILYIVAQLFFQLLSVLDERLAATLCTLNTWVWLAMLITLAVAALLAAWRVRWHGRFDYPLLGRALRREIERLDAEERRRAAG